MNEIIVLFCLSAEQDIKFCMPGMVNKHDFYFIELEVFFEQLNLALVYESKVSFC